MVLTGSSITETLKTTTADKQPMTIKLAILDIDGTVLQNHTWQYVHRKLGTWNQAQIHYNRFFSNEITYEEWARLDAALWQHQPASRITAAVSQMPYVAGAKETLAALKQNNIKTYLLSAGLTHAAARIQRETGVDGYTANHLVAKGGILTGEVEVNVSFHNKDKNLSLILQKFNLTTDECAAVGDDLTLVPLFKKVALAIAFNTVDEAITKYADVAINGTDLRAILPYILQQH